VAVAPWLHCIIDTINPKDLLSWPLQALAFSRQIMWPQPTIDELTIRFHCASATVPAASVAQLPSSFWIGLCVWFLQSLVLQWKGHGASLSTVGQNMSK
jgi:hypothetical protein